MIKRSLFPVVLILVLFASFGSAVPTSDTQPVAVDNRPGSGTYQQVTVPANFWANADPLQRALSSGQHYGIFSASGALVNPSASTFFAQNPPPSSTPDAATLAATLESARLYPVFVLPMGTGWYDFELKATITDWSGGTMVYWYASAMDSAPSNPIWDGAPKIWFTNPESGDPRVWRVSNNDDAIYEQLGGTNNSRINALCVIPSKISGSSAWMYKGNTKLVWSYVRISATGFEKDALNNPVWQPIVPVDWRTAPINP